MNELEDEDFFKDVEDFKREMKRVGNHDLLFWCSYVWAMRMRDRGFVTFSRGAHKGDAIARVTKYGKAILEFT